MFVVVVLLLTLASKFKKKTLFMQIPVRFCISLMLLLFVFFL